MARIQPLKFYSFSEAAKLIPNCRGEEGICPETLHRWRESGLLHANQHQSGKRCYWLVQGRELLKLIARIAPHALTEGAPDEEEASPCSPC